MSLRVRTYQTKDTTADRLFNRVEEETFTTLKELVDYLENYENKEHYVSILDNSKTSPVDQMVYWGKSVKDTLRAIKSSSGRTQKTSEAYIYFNEGFYTREEFNELRKANTKESDGSRNEAKEEMLPAGEDYTDEEARELLAYAQHTGIDGILLTTKEKVYFEVYLRRKFSLDLRLKQIRWPGKQHGTQYSRNAYEVDFSNIGTLPLKVKLQKQVKDWLNSIPKKEKPSRFANEALKPGEDLTDEQVKFHNSISEFLAENKLTVDSIVIQDQDGDNVAYIRYKKDKLPLAIFQSDWNSGKSDMKKLLLKELSQYREKAAASETGYVVLDHPINEGESGLQLNGEWIRYSEIRETHGQIVVFGGTFKEIEQLMKYLEAHNEEEHTIFTKEELHEWSGKEMEKEVEEAKGKVDFSNVQYRYNLSLAVKEQRKAQARIDKMFSERGHVKSGKSWKIKVEKTGKDLEISRVYIWDEKGAYLAIDATYDGKTEEVLGSTADKLIDTLISWMQDVTGIEEDIGAMATMPVNWRRKKKSKNDKGYKGYNESAIYTLWMDDATADEFEREVKAIDKNLKVERLMKYKGDNEIYVDYTNAVNRDDYSTYNEYYNALMGKRKQVDNLMLTKFKDNVHILRSDESMNEGADQAFYFNLNKKISNVLQKSHLTNLQKDKKIHDLLKDAIDKGNINLKELETLSNKYGVNI